MARGKMGKGSCPRLVCLSLVFLVLLLACAALVQAAKVLHLGDSHTAGPYGRELHSLLKSAGHTVESYGCVGASARHYSGSPKECKDRTPGADGKMILIGSRKDDRVVNYMSPSADDVVRSFDPDIVIVSLGANYLNDPSESARLVERLQGKTCFWVGPPNGPNKDAAGMEKFYSALKSVAGHCTVIDSRPLTQFNFCGDEICCCDANVHFDRHGASGVAAAKSWATGVFRQIQSGSSVSPAAKVSPLPVCDGGDLTKLKGQYARCLKHRDLFDRYARKHGVYDLGVDLLTLFVIAVGESGCRTREELKAVGSNTADGGIMQVDSPCLYQPDKCPTVEDEIEWGIKYVKRGVEKVLAQGYTGEDALNLYFFAYNRGEGAMARAVKNMKDGGMELFEAADEACSYYYGYPGSPENGKCGVERSNGKRPCRYDYYCGSDVRDSDNQLTGVHYAKKRIGWLKSACSSIGGVFKEGVTVSQQQLGPDASLSSSYLYGIDKAVLAPYSILPSFTLTIPSLLGVFDDVLKELPSLESCASDVGCMEDRIVSLNARPGSPVWLAKSAGTVMPGQDFAAGSPAALWTDACEGTGEYLTSSFAEALDTLKGSLDDMCRLEVHLGEPDDWDERESIFGGYPDMTLDARGSTARISFPDTDSVEVEGVYLYVDDGDVELADDFDFDIGDYGFDEPFLLVREKKERFLFVEPGREAKYAQLPVCNFSKRMVKLCIFDPDVSMWKYDPEDRGIVNSTARLNFAYLFERRMTDVAEVDVRPALFASETVLVTWKRISSVDVPVYEIYYSEVNDRFKGAPTASLSDASSLMADVSRIAVNVNLSEDRIFDSTRIDESPDCVWDDEGLGFCTPRYNFTNTTGHDVLVKLEPGEVYFDRTEDMYIYVLAGVPDDTVLNYGVIGIDRDNVRSPNVKSPDSPGYAIDDVPPVPPADLSASRTASGGVSLSWSVDDLKNIDASLAGDISSYLVFCTSKEKDDFSSMGGEAGALTVVGSSPANIDAALFDSGCAGKDRVILLPKDASGNLFKWETSSVVIS